MRGGGAGSPPLGWAMRSTSYKLQATSSGATATLWVKRCFGIRAEQHLAVRLEVDVQHVVRVRYAWVSRLKLDGLPEHLHRSLPYICSLPLPSPCLSDRARVRAVFQGPSFLLETEPARVCGL